MVIRFLKNVQTELSSTRIWVFQDGLSKWAKWERVQSAPQWAKYQILAKERDFTADCNSYNVDLDILQIVNGSNAQFGLSLIRIRENRRQGKARWLQCEFVKTIIVWWREWLCYCLTHANICVNNMNMKFAKVHWHQVCVSAWNQNGLMNIFSTNTCEDGSLMNLAVCNRAYFIPAWLTKVCLKKQMDPLFGYPNRN